MIKLIPQGQHTLTVHLVVSDGARAIQFYRRALGVSELYRFCTRQGKIVLAELQLGECRILLSDETPDGGIKSARAHGGCSALLRVYAEDVDTLAQMFVGAGGFIVHPVRLQLNGDRSGQFRDPEGYHWTLAQHLEDVSPDQLEQRLSQVGISLWRPRNVDPRRPTKPPPRSDD